MHGDAQRSEGDHRDPQADVGPGPFEPFAREPPHVEADDPGRDRDAQGEAQTYDDGFSHESVLEAYWIDLTNSRNALSSPPVGRWLRRNVAPRPALSSQ